MDISSFDDFTSQIRDGEPFASGVMFFPMHRVERLELDLPEGNLPSLAQRFAQRTGQDPAPILVSEFLPPSPEDEAHNAPHAAERRESAKDQSQGRKTPETPSLNLRQILTAPNQLTLLRMIFLPFIVINMVKHDFKWALALFILAGLSDGLDGLLARTLHQQTVLGQYLDPIADKLLMSTMFLVLSIERQNSVEVHRRGLQPRHLDPPHQRRPLHDRRPARLPPQHLRQSQHLRANRPPSFSCCCCK